MMIHNESRKDLTDSDDLYLQGYIDGIQEVLYESGFDSIDYRDGYLKGCQQRRGMDRKTILNLIKMLEFRSRPLSYTSLK
jgi:hypothetical protein